MKKKVLIIGLISTLFISTNSVFASDLNNDTSFTRIENVKEITSEFEVNPNARGVGGVIAGTIIGAAVGTLTGVIDDITSNNNIGLGSILEHLGDGAVSGGLAGLTMPF